MRNCLKYGVLLLVLLAGCQSDLYTKQLAPAGLRTSRPIILHPDFFELRYVENTGMGFSLMSNLPTVLRVPLLIGLPLILAIGFAIIVWRSTALSIWQMKNVTGTAAYRSVCCALTDAA